MLHLTLRQLQVFESCARHLSLSRAAEELHLSQPGVSMQMKKLSEAVGQPLLEQNGKRLQLTDQGQELLAASRDILGALKRFELSLVARTGLTKGNLRLVAISTATYFVPRLLGEFAQLHPGVKASLRVANREQLLETLAAGLEDLYILGQPPEALEGYWRDLYFNGVVPPFVLASEEAVIRFVASTPGAIGYVSACPGDKRVRVLMQLDGGPPCPR